MLSIDSAITIEMSEDVKQIFSCLQCGKPLTWHNDYVECGACAHKYNIDSGVVQFIDTKDDFYEGVYVRQINYLPNKNIFKNWGFFHLVQSGILGEIKKILPPHGVALDVGCGGGIKWLGAYAQTIGMELSQASLVEAKKCYAEVVRGDIQKMPFRDASLDLVYGSYVFEHLSPEVKKNFLSEVFRVLKPGGACVLQFDTLSNNWITRFALQDAKAYKKGFIDTDGHIGLEPLSLGIKRIETAGLKVTRVMKFGTTVLQYQATYGWLNTSYGDKYSWVRHVSRLVNWILSKRLGIVLEFLVTAVDRLINPFSKTDAATRAIVVAVKSS